jgi:hypothetical protein
LNFDTWSAEIATQMQRKGHGFDPRSKEHSSGLLGLVITELVEAAQEWKREHLKRPGVIAGELADALIRIGHFASTVGVRFNDDRRFQVQGFNDLGDQQRSDEDTYDAREFWRGLNDLLWLTHTAAHLHEYWRSVAQAEMISSGNGVHFARGLRRSVVEICVAARRLNLDLDAAVAERTAHNEARPTGYNIAAAED